MFAKQAVQNAAKYELACVWGGIRWVKQQYLTCLNKSLENQFLLFVQSLPLAPYIDAPDMHLFMKGRRIELCTMILFLVAIASLRTGEA